MTASIAQQKIRIRLKAFDRRMLDLSCDKIIQTADTISASAIGPIADADVVSAGSIIFSQDKSSILLSKALRRIRIFCWAIAVDIMGLPKAN